MSIASIHELSKSFGSKLVIDRISLEIPENSIYGFIGQNGAGKTTTMKMILGLLKQDSGSIEVCGEQVTYGQTKTNSYIGYLPDVPEFYPYMTAKEYLRLCGEIVGLSGRESRLRSEHLLEMVGLEGAKHRIGGFSRGMKQRLGIAQALINEPKLLICDEPTSALDPVGRKELLDILEQVKDKTTVLFSTHILSDVERICDHIALLHEGRLALCGTLSELKEQHKQDSLVLEFPEETELLAFSELVHQMGGKVKQERNGKELVLKASDIKGVQRQALEILTEKQLLPNRFEIIEPSIETLFLEVIQ